MGVQMKIVGGDGAQPYLFQSLRGGLGVRPRSPRGPFLDRNPQIIGGHASLFPGLGTELCRSQVSLFHEKNELFPRSWGDKG